MTTIFRRSLVLSFSRFANQAIVLISPMLLVRLLSVVEYGRYREFLLYVGVVGAFVTFGVRQSLLYFLPKHPQRESTWITQSVLYSFALSCIAVVVLLIAHDLVVANLSFDFLDLLILYIVFFFNLSFLESLWLGKKRTDLVLYISATRLIIRMIVVATIAALVGEAQAMIYGLIGLEIVRCVLVFTYSLKQNWFTSNITIASLKEQALYFLPLGAGGMVETLNRRVGAIFVSSFLGAEALAFFVIGSFSVPIVNTLRGAIADVIFPEILELRHATAADALPLWQAATVWYCILLFPVVTVFFVYSDTVVSLLFTTEYLAAAPVFSAFALLLVVYCFDFHLPLRVQNKNRYFLAGSIVALIAHTIFLYPLYQYYGLVGPVVAYLVSQFLLAAYLAVYVCRIYEVPITTLVRWRQVFQVLFASIICFPVLIVGQIWIEDMLLRGLVAVPVYFVLYVFLLRMLGIWDGFAVINRLFRAYKRT